MKELKTVSSWFKDRVREGEVWWKLGKAQQDLNLFIDKGKSQRALVAKFSGENSKFDPTLFGDKSFLILKTASEDRVHGFFTEIFYCVMYKKDSAVLIFGVDQGTIANNFESNYWPARGAKKIPTGEVSIGGSIIGGELNSVYTVEKIEVYKLGLPVGVRHPVTRSARQVASNAVPNAA